MTVKGKIAEFVDDQQVNLGQAFFKLLQAVELDGLCKFVGQINRRIEFDVKSSVAGFHTSPYGQVGLPLMENFT